MKIVIGGASGLIGKRLVRALRARGDQVVELVRAHDGAAEPGQPRNTESRQQWDGRSQGAWVACIEGADAVINLSGASIGEKRWTDERKKEIEDSRVESTRALVSAMRVAGERPKVFVCASAVGYYGPREGEPVDETARPGSDFLAEVCVAWEAEARSAEQLGVRAVMVRTGIVLAPEGEHSALDQLAMPFKLFVGGKVGSGKQWFPWIHVDDEVAVFLHALNHPDLHGPINACAPGIQTMEEFSRSLGAAMHRPSWLPVPSAALHLALGEFANSITTGQRAVPAKLASSGYRFRFPDLDVALDDLLHREGGKRASA